MDIKSGINLHNRFEIEVRDKKTNALKQKGIAENIILDRAYTRVCAFNSYFTAIHFGTGTGTLSPSRTKLFSPLGYKNASVEEQIVGFPVSRVTRKIQLNADEYVGETLTEVGISEDTSLINTHALINDAEGNPLSITKTELDVVIIYATVYIELRDTDKVKFNKTGVNGLIHYFVKDDPIIPIARWGNVEGQTPFANIGHLLGSQGLTRTSDPINKKVTFATRLETGTANEDIRELELYNNHSLSRNGICRVNLDNPLVWPPFTIQDVPIGLGDGLTDTFNLGRYDASDVKIKIDDNIISSGYILENVSGDHRRSFPLGYKVADPMQEEISKGCFVGEQESMRNIGPITVSVDPDIVEDKEIEISLEGRSYGTAVIYVRGSTDGQTFTSLGYVRQDDGGSTIGTVKIDQAFSYLQFESNAPSVSFYCNYIRWLNPDYAIPQIVFDSPPAADSVITADYTVPYIPKTSDYVLDITFDINYAEGVTT